MSVDYYFKNRLSKNSKELQQIMDKPWFCLLYTSDAADD